MGRKKHKKEKFALVHFGLAAVQKRCNLVTSAKFGQRSPPHPKKRERVFNLSMFAMITNA